MKIEYRVELSIMMFFQYFIWGAWYVTMGTFLSKTLHCNDVQVGSAYGFTALAFIISPFFSGLVADKFFDSEKIIGALHILGAALLYLMSLATDFEMFFPFFVIYMLIFAPTIALTSSLAMQQIKDPEKNFPSIRVLGTIGWIVSGLLIGFGGVDETSSTPFILAAGASLFLGLYSFFLLPHTPPKDKGKSIDIKTLLGLDAIGLFKNNSFRMLIISIFLSFIPMTFYFQFGNMFMNEIGIGKAAAIQTLGQVSEIGFMLILPFFMLKFGMKRIFLIGISAWIIRYILFAFGDSGSNIWMIFVGIALHGVCYDFLLISGQIYIDKLAPKNLRSSAQALVATATYGLGMFIGSYVAGVVGSNYAIEANLHIWNPIWLIAAGLVVVILILFALLFKDRSKQDNYSILKTKE